MRIEPHLHALVGDVNDMTEMEDSAAEGNAIGYKVQLQVNMECKDTMQLIGANAIPIKAPRRPRLGPTGTASAAQSAFPNYLPSITGCNRSSMYRPTRGQNVPEFRT
jgi:hypothetical protein